MCIKTNHKGNREYQLQPKKTTIGIGKERRNTNKKQLRDGDATQNKGKTSAAPKTSETIDIGADCTHSRTHKEVMRRDRLWCTHSGQHNPACECHASTATCPPHRHQHYPIPPKPQDHPQ